MIFANKKIKYNFLILSSIVIIALLVIINGYHISYFSGHLYLNGAPVLINNKDLDTSKNFIIILTDDQYYHSLDYMPLLENLAKTKGVVFNNAFITNPECCPSRASLLSGGYDSHETGVKTNDYTNGYKYFEESRTLGTWLQAAGYSTGFIGRYLHGYKPGHVPPGWSYFVTHENGVVIDDWFNLYNITYGSSSLFSTKREIKNQSIPVNKYITDFQEEEAINFINKNADKPFFLVLSLYSPHTPMTPANQADISVVKDVNLECITETDISDKPLWVRVVKQFREKTSGKECGAQHFRKMLAALQSVDRSVSEIIKHLSNMRLLDKTVVFYLTDNGMNLGRSYMHYDKGMPYEGSIKTPLIVFYPGVSPVINSELIAANLDIGATIFDSIGITDASEGLSLIPLLNGSNNGFREDILIENYGYLEWRKIRNNEPIPTVIWSGLRTRDWKYIEYTSGESELYNMIEDPNELNNLIYSDSHLEIIQKLSKDLRTRKGLTVVSTEIPEAIIDKFYKFNLKAWGGKPPYKWEIIRGNLPKGINFDSTNGIISGTPRETGKFKILIMVIDNEPAKHSRKNQQFSWWLNINVAAKN